MEFIHEYLWYLNQCFNLRIEYEDVVKKFLHHSTVTNFCPLWNGYEGHSMRLISSFFAACWLAYLHKAEGYKSWGAISVPVSSFLFSLWQSIIHINFKVNFWHCHCITLTNPGLYGSEWWVVMAWFDPPTLIIGLEFSTSHLPSGCCL